MITLYKGPRTRVTQQIVKLAARTGLNPHVSFPPYRGVYEILLDAKRGPESPFGVIHVGARSGRVLSASLYARNSATPCRARGAVAVRRLIKNWGWW